ncbi:cytochrome P450 [Limnohabitans sp.]|uniref:cytochrome P450 n=1 Tax=Limnohabitans sp. TaxID=1907725 RepID=UPI00286ECA99|nr:cytochrome P450 [Limnohabitans sp.]
MTKLTPPVPMPLKKSKIGIFGFWRVAYSWIDALSHKSYEMLLGHFWLPAMRVFIINDPKWVERILVKEPANYPKHRLMHESLEPLIGSSPFTTNGKLWGQQRRMLDQAFGHARLSLVFPLMQQACADMLGRFEQHDLGKPLDVDAAMTHVTADIVYRTIFSAPLGEDEATSLFAAFTRYQEFAQKVMVCRLLRLPVFLYDYRRRQYANVIREFLGAKVRARFEFLSMVDEQNGADILSGLRTAIDPEDGSVLTEKEVLDQVCMLFLAGHETSASSLSWCFYVLGEAPELQSQLQEELLEVAPTGELAFADLRRLSALPAMFREVLRLYPPVGYFPREATQDQEIRGAKVRKGDALLVFPWLLHRHRRWWREPDVFKPARFLDKDRAPVRGTYLPFGLGARACIGAGFAMQEAELILSAVMKNYDVMAVPGFEPQVVGRLTVRSDKGIQVMLKRKF